MNKFAIILAAGKGTRMKSGRSDVSKVSFPILGRPMVKYVLEALKPLGMEKIVTVVGFGGETTKSIVEGDSEVVWQNEQKGTGHAVMMAASALSEQEGETIICCGDTPLLTSKTPLGPAFQPSDQPQRPDHTDLGHRRSPWIWAHR